MPRNINTIGGGAQTNSNGLKFEQSTLLDDALREKGYIVKDCYVYLDGNIPIGMSVYKRNLYSKFLKNIILIIVNLIQKDGNLMIVILILKMRQLILLKKSFRTVLVL